MLLKNLMEDKQLNFDQPLLSTRRYPSTVSNSEAENRRKRTDNALPKVTPLPKYKSELKSGPVRNPGTVPFVWEQMPGRPKTESRPQIRGDEFHAVAAPKPPPGRILNAKREAPDGASEGGTDVNHLKSKKGHVNSQNVPLVDKNMTKEVFNEAESEEIEHSDVQDDSSVYVDAVDTLSRCESFFMTCSVSGVSGLDGTDFRLLETYQTDSQARDFMIGRFLPAAKAMASEMPQHSDKRHLVPKEQPTKKIVTIAKRCSPNPYQANNVLHYTQTDTIEDSDDDDVDNVSHNLCGLLPRLCLQNSFCLLNPVPGIRKQPELPMKSVRTRNLKSPYVSSRETQNKDALFERRSELDSSRNGLKKLDGTSPSSDLQDRSAKFLGITEKTQIPEGNNRIGNDGITFQELLMNETNEWAASSRSSEMVERTLYIDSLHTLNPKRPNSVSSDTTTTEYTGNEVQMPLKSPKTVSVDSVVPDDSQNSSVLEKSEVLLESSESPDYHSLSSSQKSVYNVELDVTDGSPHCKDLEKDSYKSPHRKVDEAGKSGLEIQPEARLGNSERLHDIGKNSSMVASSKFNDNEMIDLESRFAVRPSDMLGSDHCNILRPLPPPLPKSPSESWLKRALPTVSSRNSAKPVFSTSIGSPKTTNFDPKWETIVRTANGHLLFSEELLTPIPEV